MLLRWVGSLFRRLTESLVRTHQGCSASAEEKPGRQGGRKLHVYIPGEGILTVDPHEVESDE
jgi:hypothetical protein